MADLWILWLSRKPNSSIRIWTSKHTFKSKREDRKIQPLTAIPRVIRWVVFWCQFRRTSTFRRISLRLSPPTQAKELLLRILTSWGRSHTKTRRADSKPWCLRFSAICRNSDRTGRTHRIKVMPWIRLFRNSIGQWPMRRLRETWVLSSLSKRQWQYHPGIRRRKTRRMKMQPRFSQINLSGVSGKTPMLWTNCTAKGRIQIQS